MDAMKYFLKKISHIYAGCGVSQTPKDNINERSRAIKTNKSITVNIKIDINKNCCQLLDY